MRLCGQVGGAPCLPFLFNAALHSMQLFGCCATHNESFSMRSYRVAAALKHISFFCYVFAPTIASTVPHGTAEVHGRRNKLSRAQTKQQISLSTQITEILKKIQKPAKNPHTSPSMEPDQAEEDAQRRGPRCNLPPSPQGHPDNSFCIIVETFDRGKPIRGTELKKREKKKQNPSLEPSAEACR